MPKYHAAENGAEENGEKKKSAIEHVKIENDGSIALTISMARQNQTSYQQQRQSA